MAGEPSSPDLPWKTKLFLFAFSLATAAVRRSDGTVNRCLLSLLDPPVRPNPEPVTGVRTADVTVDPARDLWFRLFLPASLGGGGGGRLPVFVFFHGGGFTFLSPASKLFDALCRRFCREIPAAVVSVNYRLAPEHRFPAPYEDGVDVLRFLSSHGGGDGGRDPLLREFFEAADLSGCFVVGDSAGGNIAAHVARRWSISGSQARGRVSLAGLVLLQPFFGGEERLESEIRLPNAPMVTTELTDWHWAAFLPEGASRDHEAASPEMASAELGEDFPPAMVVVGGFDPLQDWQRRYYEGLRREGREAKLLEYPGAIHGFYGLPELKDAPAVMKELKVFVDEKEEERRRGDRRR